MRITDWLKGFRALSAFWLTKQGIRKSHSSSVRYLSHGDIEALESRTLLSASHGQPIAPVYLPALTQIVPTGSLLTGPQTGDAYELAMSYLTANAGALGLNASDLANPLVTDAYRDTDSGTTYIYLKQQFNGLEVENTTLNIAVTSAGEIITVGSRFVPGLAALEGLPEFAVAPVLSPIDALVAMTHDLGLETDNPATDMGGTDELSQPRVIENVKWSLDPISVHLEYVATETGPKLTWSAVIRTPDGEHWYNTFADATTGQLLLISDWIDDLATYNVVAAPSENPEDGGRTVLVNPANPTYSPFGWHDTNGVAGSEFTDTRGNNVFAQEDLDANDTGGTRPSGGSALSFDFPFDLTQAPSAYRSTAITNLFYLNNYLHDVHASYGFTEVAGNFQFLNYSGQGAGGDAVQADAQDGSGINNANFGTPPDGFAPRMQQFIFTTTTPNRDSDVDNGVVIHEYGHGVSNRLTGGPANSNALNSLQSGGMGEGWSDFWAMMLTQRTTDTKLTAYPMGNYVLGLPANGAGIRTYPYSFSMAINPHTWTDYNVVTQEVHYSGEIWASALWDLNWMLIDKFGFDPDLNTGWTAGGGPAGAGNKLALRLVMEGLKLQPANPSFINGRDAILAADQALTGGKNQREIWTAFARRGLGFGASTASADATSVVTSFSVPVALSNPSVVDVNPAGTTNVAPSSLDVIFSEAMNQTSFSVAADVASFTGPGGVNLLPAITGFSWTDSTTLHITFTPQTTQGQYSMVLGPNILSNDNDSPLNQDGDGTPGEATQDQFTAFFAYDSSTLTVTSTGPADGSTVNLPVTNIVVNFSGAFNPSTLSASDLQVSQGTVTGAVATDADTATFTISGLTQGLLYLNLKYGALSDLAGFASEFYTGLINLQFPSDFGDAPNSYGTLAASNGANHTVGGPFLGATVDREADGQPNATATGDGADEDGIVLYEPLVTGATAQIQVTSGGTGAKRLNYFFDFDHNGVFGNNANEIFSVLLSGGTELIPVTVPAGSFGNTIARFRLSTVGGLGATGPAPDGEVEDYRFSIFATAPGQDFGDAPSPAYATSLASGGARHAATGPQLGASRDAELDGQFNSTATGDGLDEDGVTFPQIFQPGGSIPVRVTSAAGGGQLNAFFDWNRNGIWGDVSNEIVSATLTGGTQTVTVPVPSTAATGITYARFRISTAGGLAATGFAIDGEVEDYQLFVVDPFFPAVLENFDGVTPPTIPSGWTNTSSGFQPQNWGTVAGVDSDAGPNHIFVANPGDTTDSRLTSPVVVPTLPRLKFRNSYDTELNWDGGVLEISIDGGAFTDILAAGGSFISGGYTTTLNNGSALGGRQTWSGNSGGYIDTIINLPASAINQNVQFRWRFASDTSVGGTGWRVDSIQFTTDGSITLDYGDAPDPLYPTLLANSGAAHAQGFSTVFLGASADSEANGQPNATGTGDDVTGTDDEDGITLPANIARGKTITIVVNAAQAGLLSAWIDFNDDGDWRDIGEQIARDFVVAAGNNNLSVFIPLTATVTAQTFARFRLSTNSGQAPDGRAPDGEVEDYALSIAAAPPAVTLSVSAATGTEAAMTVITVTATASANVVGNQTVNLGVSGTNVTASDYLLSNTLITIPNGTRTGTVTFTIQDDALIEATETAILSLFNESDGLRLGGVITQNVAIIDNDTHVSIAWINDGVEAIVPTNGKFRVSQSAASAVNTVVAYVVSGTATSGLDYTVLTGTVTIIAGMTSADINVAVLNELLVEGTESVTVTITNLTASDPSVVLDPNPANRIASLNIVDNDSATISIARISDGLDQSAPVNGKFRVTQSAPSSTDTVVFYSVAGSAIPGAGNDYTSLSGTVTILAGQTTADIDVAVLYDAIIEGTETVDVTLTSLGAHDPDITLDPVAGNRTATVNILETETSTLTISSVTVTEGNVGTTTIAFTVTSPVAVSGGFSLGFTLNEVSVDGVDYSLMTTAPLVFQGTANETQTIFVDVVGDQVIEANEVLSITLGTVTPVAPVVAASIVSGAIGTVTITNDDSSTLTIDSPTVTEGDGGTTTMTFTVMSPLAVQGGFTVGFNVANLTTTAADFVTASLSPLTFAGTVGESQTIIVNVTGDIVVELNETFSITLGTVAATLPGAGAGIVTGAIGTGTITDNDLATFTINSVSGSEAAGSLAFTLTIDKPLDVDVKINVAFGGGSAIGGADYVDTTQAITFLAGQTSKTVNVPISENSIVEATETFGASLSLAGVAGTRMIDVNDTGTGTITDNDSTVFQINSVSVNESAGMLVYDITATNAVDTDVLVNVTFADQTATGLSDYAAAAQSISFLAGQTFGQISVPISNDVLNELTERFAATIGSSTSLGGRDVTVSGTGIGTIVDNDAATFTINNVTGSENAPALVFDLVTDVPFDVDVTISVTFSDATATGSGIDYASTTQQITFLAGQTSLPVSVPINNDDLVEASEGFSLALSAVTSLIGRTVQLSDQGTGTIVDNDTATVSITKTADGIEASIPTHGRFRVTQSALSSTDTIVQYSISGLATPGAGNDYAALTGTVTIPAGQSFVDLDVNVFDDAIVEGTETVIVTLTGFSAHDPDITLNATPANVTATVDITDSDTTTLSINNAELVEGSNGTTTVTFTVTSPNAVQGGFALAFNVANVTTSNNDYSVLTNSPVAFSGTVNESRTITVVVQGDTMVESNEQFSVTLGTVTPTAPVLAGSIISGATGTATITDDDTTLLAISSPNVVEGDAGTTLMTFDVTSPNAVEGGFRVAFSTADFTATGSDYTVLTASPLVFAGTANEVQTITISVTGDITVERNEQLRVTLGGITAVAPVPSANIQSGAVGTGTITDNDTAAFIVNNVTVNEADGTLVFNVTTAKPLDIDVTLNVTFVDQTASGNDLDYTSTQQQITFLAGETSKTVSLSIMNDTLVEAAETFAATLSTTTPLAGRSVDLTSTGIGTIADNDSATFTINNASVGEASATITFDLSTDRAIDTNIVVAVTLANGTATGDGVDFSSTTILVPFPAGLLTRPVSLLISEDGIVEADETFTASLGTTTSLEGRSVIFSDTGTGTIVDNDSATVSIAKIADVDEAFAPTVGKFRVTQTNVSATDTIVTYVITGTATSGAGNDYVMLTGSVTIPAGQTSADIDVSVLADGFVESNEIISLTLTGLSAGDPEIGLDTDELKLTDTLNIIDDDQLVLTNVSSVSIPENTPIATVIVDANSDPTRAPGHALTYSLSGPDAALFNINSATGVITFRSNPDFDLPADEGADNIYNATVTVAADVTPVRATSTDFTVTVTGLNDNVPLFVNASPTLTVPENSAVGVIVGSAAATDADRPMENLSYSILSGNSEGAFSLDPATGQITVADPTLLDFESPTTMFTFTVRATDNGTPANTTDAVVVVHVANVVEGPTISIPTETATFQPGPIRVPAAPDAEFTFGDVAVPNFNGSTLIVSIVSGRMSKDVLGIFKGGDPTGQIVTKRHGVYANGELIGTFSGGRGRHPSLLVKLNGNTNTASLEALMRRVSFSSKSTTLTTRLIQLQIVDVNGASSNLATREISVQ